MIEYESLKKVNEPFFEEFKKSFADTLETGWYILGKNVENFEKEFAVYNSSKHCIGVASGLVFIRLKISELLVMEELSLQMMMN
ncbi:MAG: hypothetical protein A2287_06160 [Candidatus Melainabacteria bacterium RIFOXYA12_FULL_32_12]|nr:MAG: hypothetical protein A2287_06160 [Candidatus Melainabacteria bacterium RIFOXYA12_FULL_32_12]